MTMMSAEKKGVCKTFQFSSPNPSTAVKYLVTAVIDFDIGSDTEDCGEYI